MLILNLNIIQENYKLIRYLNIITLILKIKLRKIFKLNIIYLNIRMI